MKTESTPLAEPTSAETTSAYYQALKSKDRRFDGRFFVAVSSTGIYCRPVCPARLPKQQNCQFFKTAAAAAHSGFRPCKRCRPELAPGLSSIDMPDALISQACRLVDHGFLQQHSIEQLSARLGISSRHLRRLFQIELGVSPLDYACNKQLLLACQLIRDTQLPITTIAMQSGFASLRSFNHRFQQYYQQTPSEFRKQLAPSNKSINKTSNKTTYSKTLQLKLGYRPPFDWRGLLSFLSKRVIPGVESVELDQDHAVYRRVVSIEAAALATTDLKSAKSNQPEVIFGWLEVSDLTEKYQLKITLSDNLAPVITEVLKRVRHLFDLDCDPQMIIPQMSNLQLTNSGLRLPGAFDSFEMSVRAILGQQITVKAAHTIASRVAKAFGQSVTTPFAELSHSFPDAKTISTLQPAQLGELGIVRQRCTAIQAIAHAINDQTIQLTTTSDIEQTLQQLQSLPGIGSWTAQYIAMRALGWPDAFLDKDLGVIKSLGSKNAKQLQSISQQWRPWRSYAVMHLWQGATYLPATEFDQPTDA
ncbi:DNA-3-methyladenine glycosylase 2 family protein [Pelagibaculum spongiae]|uniref:DNA-3-methyladenine glycosylase II n=1 Tax=Pelagibaculum spongiae TaxID=2080658 RepID=A0A2V1GQ00_9GAMM|nr:DNA-3-methyladenine glycosylase 2 family protein [Pelagibaculum spongiae]PVZ65416.1 adenosine deaminase [Pelagibaculum spongiae]